MADSGGGEMQGEESVSKAMHRQNSVEAVRRYMSAHGCAAAAACKACGVSPASYARWAAKVDQGGGAVDAPRPGRPLSVELDEATARALRETYVRANKGKRACSMTTAARLFARSKECPKEVAEVILAPRTSKHNLPESITRHMRLTHATIARHENKKAATLNTLPYAPGGMRTSACGTRRLMAGERQSWDDASVNGCFWVPWTMGGDACSDRYGVRLGRFQLLLGIDDATDYCAGFVFVVRGAESYRGADVARAMYEAWSREHRPGAVVVEGGVWQSRAALGFYEAAGVPFISAKGRPNQKLVENYFNRMWTPLGTRPGNVGRFRGQIDEVNKMYLKCRRGEADPREHFPSLECACDDVAWAADFLNTEPVESKHYGTWIPQDRYFEDLAAQPRSPLDASVAWAALPERHTRTVRKGMVQCRVPSVAGFTVPYVFAGAELLAFEGREVGVHFSPAGQYAAISHAGKLVVPRVPLISDVPVLLRDDTGFVVDTARGGAMARAKAARKAAADYVRTEYRGLGLKSDKDRLSAERDERGERSVEVGQHVPGFGYSPASPAPMSRVSAEDEEEMAIRALRAAEADAFENEVLF